jgi:hypothetical protein
VKNEEINREIYPPAAPIRCKWIKVKDVLANYPLKMTRLYELIKTRRVRSFALKDRPGAIRGIRLIDRDSLDLFFEMEAARSEAEEQKPDQDSVPPSKTSA